jgi:hypothetical protein
MTKLTTGRLKKVLPSSRHPFNVIFYKEKIRGHLEIFLRKN